MAMATGLVGRATKLLVRVPRALARRAVLVGRRAAGRERVVFFEREGGGDAALAEGLSLEERSPEALRVFGPVSDDARQRVRDGSRLFVLERGGELLSVGWVTRTEKMFVGELGRALRLNRPAVWIWDCATPSVHRGRGYYPALLRAICARLPGEHVVIFARAENEPSLRGIRKAGFVETATIARGVLRVTVARRPGAASVLRDG